MIKKSVSIIILQSIAALAVGLWAIQASAAPVHNSQLPAAPSKLVAAMSVQPPLKVSLSWSDNARSEGGFTIERAENLFFTAGLTTFQAGGANTKAWTDTTARPGTTYYYRVQARNGSGGSDWSGVASVAALVPEAPVSLMGMQLPLSAKAPTVKLAWTDQAANEAGFTIQRAADAAFTQGLATFTVGANVTKYTDPTAPPVASLHYRVRAFNGAGASAWSGALALTTPGKLPQGPASLKLTGATRNAITLRWADSANDEQGFYIERSTVGFNGPWTRIATLNTDNQAGYTNTGLARGTHYWYRVQTFNGAGDSVFSNVVAAKTLP